MRITIKGLTRPEPPSARNKSESGEQTFQIFLEFGVLTPLFIDR